MTGGISSRTCYTKLTFDFPYVRFLSLRRDPYTCILYLFTDLTSDFHQNFTMQVLTYQSTYQQPECFYE